MREKKAIAAFAEVWLWRDLIDVMRRYRERWWCGSGRWSLNWSSCTGECIGAVEAGDRAAGRRRVDVELLQSNTPLLSEATSAPAERRKLQPQCTTQEMKPCRRRQGLPPARLRQKTSPPRAWRSPRGLRQAAGLLSLALVTNVLRRGTSFLDSGLRGEEDDAPRQICGCDFNDTRQQSQGI